MDFIYTDKVLEKGLYWTVATAFDDKKWSDLVWKIRKNHDVVLTGEMLKWIEDSIEAGRTIVVSLKEYDEETGNWIPDKQYMLSPGMWQEQLKAYIGVDKATEIILDFQLKVAKKAWDEAKSAADWYKNNPKGFAKDVVENIKKVVENIKKEEAKLDNDARKVIPSGIDIEDSYAENLTIETKLDFYSATAVLEIAGSKAEMTLNNFLAHCVKKVQFVVTVRVPFAKNDIAELYTYQLSSNENILVQLRNNFEKDLSRAFTLPADVFDAVWKSLTEDLTEEMQKIIAVAAKYKLEINKTEIADTPLNYQEIKIPFNVPGFSGAISFYLKNYVYDAFMKYEKVTLNDLFERGTDTKVVLRGKGKYSVLSVAGLGVVRSFFGDRPVSDYTVKKDVEFSVTGATSFDDFREKLYQHCIRYMEVDRADYLVEIDDLRYALLNLKRVEATKAKDSFSKAERLDRLFSMHFEILEAMKEHRRALHELEVAKNGANFTRNATAKIQNAKSHVSTTNKLVQKLNDEFDECYESLRKAL